MIKRIMDFLCIMLIILATFAPFDLKRLLVCLSIFLLINVKYFSGLVRIKKEICLIIAVMVIAEIYDLRNIANGASFALSGVLFVSWFYISIIINKRYTYNEFINHNEGCCFFISICSLVGFSVLLRFPGIIELFPTINYYGRINNNIILFNAIHVDMGYEMVLLKRNCGIAFEPGAFQMIPNIGLAILLSENGLNRTIRYKIIAIFVYIVAIATTKSTVGLLAMLVILLYKTVPLLKTRKILVAITGIVIGGILFRNQLEYQIFKMFYTIGGISSRFENTRYVWKNYLFINPFGLGSSAYKQLYADNNAIGAYDVYTNFYLRYGILFLVILIYFTIKLYQKNKYLCTVIALTLLTESLLGTATIPFLYYGLNSKDCREANY